MEIFGVCGSWFISEFLFGGFDLDFRALSTYISFVYVPFVLCEIMCIYIDCCMHHAYHVRVDLGVDVICIYYRACIFMRLVGVLTPSVCPITLFCFVLFT